MRGMGTEIDVAMYGTISALLNEEGADREAILKEHGLDEETWEAAEKECSQQISDAMEADVELTGVPEALTSFSNAYVLAQQGRKSTILSLEGFAAATKAISGSRDIPGTLAQHGLTLQQFLQANEHWTHRMISDPTLAEKFRKMFED